MGPRMTIEILFVAWNRLAMTSAAWSWMFAHTNWDLVSRLVVYDDGSEDGTLEFLRERVAKGKIRHHHRDIPIELRVSDLRSPPAVMNHFIATCEADAFVKVDNDIALPGGWLEKLAGVFEQHPEVDLLGMEAGMMAMQGRDGQTREYTAEPCTHIGGVGIMRMSGFRTRPEIPYRGRYGFQEWQDRYDVPRAWITPDIACPQLDRVPLEPWVTLTEQYVEQGWSRPWPKYEAKWVRPYYSWIEADSERVAGEMGVGA
jgi:glycosyltransferase involved in cell wall biosynthesis